MLSIAAGAEVVSDNSGDDAITLRGTDINIATGVNPAIVGADRDQLNPTPSRILTGLNDPGASAFDAQGNLYVVNIGARHGERLRAERHDADRRASPG